MLPYHIFSNSMLKVIPSQNSFNENFIKFHENFIGEFNYFNKSYKLYIRN